MKAELLAGQEVDFNKFILRSMNLPEDSLPLNTPVVSEKKRN
ncbi:MAG: hypothetical protein E6234_05735 [Sutterella wadsworthensis]|jgi:hypothetical protein|nr:hypothetical protein [Sutterella wadsworthensis]